MDSSWPTSFQAQGAEGADETVFAAALVVPGRNPPERPSPAPERNPPTGTQETKGASTLDREDHGRQTKRHRGLDREPRPGGAAGDEGNHAR